MSTTQDSSLRVLGPGDALPEAAVDLFGTEVRDAWRQAPRPEAVPLPLCVLIGSEAAAAAGIYMLIEPDREAGEAEGGRVASIRQLVVKPAHRGRGLAGRLLRRALQLAEEHGCRRLRSTAGWGCPDHLALYDRLDFRRAAPADRPYLVTKSLEG